MSCARDALWERRDLSRASLPNLWSAMAPKVKTTAAARLLEPAAQRDSLPPRPCRKRWFDDGAGKAWGRDHLPRCEAYIGVEDVSANASRIDENGEAPRYPKVAQDENLEALAVLPGKTEGPIRLIFLRASVGGRDKCEYC